MNNQIIVPQKRLLVPKSAMLHLPKYKDMSMELPKRTGRIGGRYKLRKGITDLKGREHVTQETDWFDNIITDYGKNGFADTTYNGLSTYTHVGSGTTAAAAGDTALVTFIAASNTTQDINDYAQGSAPYYGTYIKTRRFGEGVAEGNINEVAVSDQATNGNAFSRARVVTAGGAPTTVVVSATEWLDVTYEFRIYPDGVTAGGAADDSTGTIAISGVDHDFVLRGAEVDHEDYLRVTVAQGAGVWFVQNAGATYGSDGILGLVTALPSGTSVDNLGSGADDTTITNAAYSAGTFSRTCTWEVGLNGGNVTGGIAAFYFRTGLGAYQCSIEATAGGAPIAKDITKVWTWVATIAWANKTIP